MIDDECLKAEGIIKEDEKKKNKRLKTFLFVGRYFGRAKEKREETPSKGILVK